MNIKNSVEILNHIQFLKDNGYDISGCPDGWHEYRSGNHMAINSFFMIVNRKALEKWVNWTGEYPQFKKEWIEEYPWEKRNDTTYTYQQPWDRWVPDTEPYYNFMWVLKESGINFYYMEPEYEPELSTTNLLNGSVIHGWHARERWDNRWVSPLHKMTNKERFDKIIENI